MAKTRFHFTLGGFAIDVDVYQDDEGPAELLCAMIRGVKDAGGTVTAVTTETKEVEL